MKIQIQKLNLKNANFQPLSFFAFLFLFIFTTSCNKVEKEVLIQEEISEEEIVEIIETALVSETKGLSTEVEDAAKIANANVALSVITDRCGLSFDTTYTYAISNNFITASYAKTIDWTVNCNLLNNVTSLTFDSHVEGSHETNNRMASSSGDAAWTVTATLPATVYYVINGSYDREGTYTFYRNNEDGISYFSQLSMNVVELEVNKTTNRILSGSADVQIIAGASPTGDVKTFTASITFEGDGAATITINGNTYPIQI